MSSSDFLAYTCDQSIATSVIPSQSTFKYVLEHRDGSLLHHTIELQDNVENVLKSMVVALESTGTASVPPPPPPPETLSKDAHENNDILWAPHEASKKASKVNHKYDVNTYKGKGLMRFLQNMDFNLVEERRASRMDVAAVALVARRAFHFLSIDGTHLGWSSASFAILLRSLVALHEEHQSKFHVDSFYPLQLVWSSEEFEDPVDPYGGILYLNPASTPIQWLDSFLKVTTDTLESLRANQAQLQESRSKVHTAFGGVKFQKGHSCSWKDYHFFLLRLSESHLVVSDHEEESTSLTLENIAVTVEASCRRAIVTREGSIRVGASMDEKDIVQAISKYAHEAGECAVVETARKHRCRETIDRAQWELGLQKVYHTKLVRTEQVLECVTRLLEMDEKDQLKRNLAGNSLGIAGSGQFCDLGDDGSVVIPWDWR